MHITSLSLAPQEPCIMAFMYWQEVWKYRNWMYINFLKTTEKKRETVGRQHGFWLTLERKAWGMSSPESPSSPSGPGAPVPAGGAPQTPHPAVTPGWTPSHCGTAVPLVSEKARACFYLDEELIIMLSFTPWAVSVRHTVAQPQMPNLSSLDTCTSANIHPSPSSPSQASHRKSKFPRNHKQWTVSQCVLQSL